MTIETRVVGYKWAGDKDKVEQAMHKKDGKPPGAVVYQDPFLDFMSETRPFLNPINGNGMNIDAQFSEPPSFIYKDGANSNADSGTTDGTTSNKLVDSGQNFLSSVSVGMVVRNTTDTTYAHITAIDSNSILSLDLDIMISGETYTIGAEWPGVALSGSWTFAPTISITAANNNDEAQFDNPFTSIMSNYGAISGKITLTTYSQANNSLFIKFGLSGVLVGAQVNVNNFIDTGLLGVEQSFVIPKEDFNLSTQTVDEMNIVITRIGGAKPTVSLNTIQFESGGGTAVYKATTPLNTIYHIDEVRLSIAANISGITAVSGATENATVPNLSFDKFFGLTQLTNGIVFQRVQNGQVVFGLLLKQLGDFLSTGADIVNHISDGTNSFITLLVKFQRAIILNGNRGDFLSFNINDDLQNLLQFSAITRGSIEI